MLVDFGVIHGGVALRVDLLSWSSNAFGSEPSGQPPVIPPEAKMVYFWQIRLMTIAHFLQVTSLYQL